MKTTLDQSVDRFLCWKLPEGFSPDCGIKFKRESDYKHPEFGCTKYEPTGTNLFDAVQAKDMLAHVTEPMQAEIDELRAENAAQRKVLEQALEAMQKIKRIEGAAWEGGSHIVAARAITAIQGVLK